MNKIRKISDVCDVFDGPHATPTKTPEGPVYLGIKAITEDGRLNASEFAHLSNSDYQTWTKRITPQENDIVFSYEATLHRYALIPRDFHGCLGRRLAIVRAKNNDINAVWLYYYFRSPKWTEFINNHIVSGSTVNRISIDDFPSYPVSLPPRSVQDNVVNVLQQIDKKIALNNRIIEELEAMAKTIYDYWFVQFDFPNAEGKPYRQSGGEMVYNEALKREMPKGWELLSLVSIESNIVTGKTPSTSEDDNYNGNIPFITIGDIRGNIFITKTEQTLSNKGADTQKNKFIPKGALCVSCIASPGLIGFATQPSQTNQQINTVVCAEEQNKIYLYFALNDHFKNSFGAKIGATFANMNKDDFSSILLIQPCDETKNDFQTLLVPVFEEIKILLTQNIELTRLRDWLLPMLMNGQATVE